jgi:hypothetical protein
MSHPCLIHHRLFKATGLLAGIIFFTACSAALVTDPNARNYVPTPGTSVTVPQRIEVPGGQTRIFFQRGEIVKKVSSLDLYKTNCNFEINTLAETPRYIEAGVYTVTRTTRREGEVVLFKPLQYASLAIGGMVGKAGDGPPMYFEEVRMTLRSDQSSDIRDLTCRGAMTDPQFLEPPTLAEIREALGKHVTITVPEEKAK